MENSIDVNGVRITPRVINFRNCELDGTYIRVVNVQNISTKNLTVRFYPPQSKSFSLICKEHEKIISSGLSHICSLKFTMDFEQRQTDRLVVTVDGNVQEVPINIFPSAPDLHIDNQIDFGVRVMANKVITQQTNITNDGSKIGEFKLIYTGTKPLNIVPNEGIVYPQSSVPIQIEYVTQEVQKIKEHCQVIFEGQDPFQITISGEVVKRSLELLDIDSEEKNQVQCIKFPYTYYGSDKSEVAVLFNNSPEKIQFVAILEEDTVGQESGSHITITASGINPKECTNPLTSLISMYPNQGYLGPYEKTPVLFRFSPRWNLPKQAFKKTIEPPLQQTFAVFIKIQIVGSGIETESTSDVSENKEDSLAKSQQLEVAITGTAAPVLVEMKPNFITFGELCDKEQKTESFILYNRSSHLPCLVDFPREAHFIINPTSARIGPNEQMEIVVTFNPKQYGNFNTKQFIKVLSYVKDEVNPFIEYEQSIYETYLNISGSCIPIRKTLESKFCNGIDPLITNKVGYLTETRFSDLGYKPNNGPVAAYVTTDASASGGLTGSKLFRCTDANMHPYNNRTAFVAFPNDRTESVRPSEHKKEFRTIFKRIKRYNYVDPDYAYEDEEMRKIQQHKDTYQTLIRKQHLLKKISELNSKFAAFENDLHLGIIPGNGLAPPKLHIEEINKEKIDKNKGKKNFQLLSTKDLKQSENVIDISKTGTFNAIPTTTIEKEQCSMVLTPQQLHQIIIGPSTINFGETCIRSMSNKEINVVNNLDQFIHVSILIDCKELRQSSPLSQVIPAKTKSNFPLVFESSKKGKFQRNLSYVINGYYQNHVIVLANVVLNHLQLSTDCLILSSSSIYPPDSGIRNTITMTNPLNNATEFLWEPIFNSSSGIAFSIRPKEGVVEAYSKLDCEVVFHPSFTAPSEGDFILRIPGNEESASENSTQDTGSSETPSISFNDKCHSNLKCIAMLGNPHVAFQSRRVIFGNIPINLASTRTAILLNTGAKHAYFRVIPDQLYEDYPGMIIQPLKGSVPVGGQAELTIKYLPVALTKFDCSVPIVIRGWKELELKISGTVIIPQIEILQKRLDCGGVPVGSEKRVDFNLINKSQCRSEVEFSFERYKDFSISIPNISESEKTIMTEGYNCLIMMKPLQDLSCQMIFTPKEVASYDFPLSVKINQIEITPTSLAQTQSEYSSLSSKTNPKAQNRIETVSSTVVTADTNRKPLLSANIVRNVTATATRQPINIPTNKFQFQFCSVSEIKSHSQKLIIFNNMEKEVEVCLKLHSATWKFGLETSSMKILSKSRSIPFKLMNDSNSISKNEDFTITLSSLGEAFTIDILFEPDFPGHYSGEFSIYINNNFDHVFQRIYLNGFLDSAALICQPEHLTFIPAPLKTEVSLDFKLIAYNFQKETAINIKLPVITKPGCNEEYQPFKYTLLTSKEIPSISNGSRITEIRGTLTFSSDVPVNIRSTVDFYTDCTVSKTVNLSASADNCQLSWQNFMNKHHSEYHIICDEEKNLEGTEIMKGYKFSDFGEPQLKPLNKDLHNVHLFGENQSLQSRNSTTMTSSNFEESSLTYEETVSESESACLETPVLVREGALNNIGEKSKHKSSNTPSFKRNQKQHEGSTSSTLEISSSVMSDKNYISINMLPNNINFINEDSTTASTEMISNKDYDIPNSYDAELLLIVQRWFTMHGWPGNLYPINVPNSFRSSLQKRFGFSQTSSKDKLSQKSENIDNSGLKSDSRDLYDMILYLTGRQIPGINTTVILPTHPTEKACHIYIQHSALIAFIESQSGQLAQTTPEQLMDFAEYELWHSTGCPGLPNKDNKPFQYDSNSFEKISKKAWTNILLQILKVYVLSKVTYKSYKHSLQMLPDLEPIPEIHLLPTISNCYSLNERILLTWLNFLYESFRSKCWPGTTSNELGVASKTPVSKWIINFENDFMDSLILATAIGAYVPFLIEQHFKYMYPNPQNPEQCLHNALKIVSALKDIGFEFDIQAIDIVDPNPVMMILFTLNLFLTLPLYVPKSEISFTGSLHEQITKHIQISNPTSKSLSYECIIIGPDSVDFSSPKGSIVNLAGKSSIKWPIVFKSRFIRPAEATVMFVGRKTGFSIPANLIFAVRSKITSTIPSKLEKISEKCYVMKKLNLKITSPYQKGGHFKVKLTEHCDTTSKISKDNNEKYENKTIEAHQMNPAFNKKSKLDAIKPQNKLRAFFTHSESIFIDENKNGSLEFFYLPFHMGIKRCTITFTNDDIGEFVYFVEATAELPEPIVLTFDETKTKSGVWVSKTEAANRGLEGNENTVYWKCEVGSFIQETLSIPISNPYKLSALNAAAQLHLSAQEVSRRQVTGTLNSSSLLLTAVNVLTIASDDQLTKISDKENKKITDTKYSNKGKLLNFEVELDSTFYNAPSFVQIPDSLQFLANDKGNKSATVSTVDIPIKFHATTAGVYPCNLVLKGPDDVRLFRIECTVTPEGNLSQIFFKIPLQELLSQNIPIVNKTKQDWPLRATITGTSAAFSGPDFIMAKALTVSQYPLQFRPIKEGKVNAKLSLFNEADGSEHVFELFGEGESPLALDSLYFDCIVGEEIKKTLQIPNSTRKKHVFSVESDLDWMILGEDSLTVLPGRSSPYELIINPKRSGKFSGILAFISGKKKILEYDSDGDEVVDIYEEENNKYDECKRNSSLYRIWYSMTVDISPGPAQETFDLKCPCLSDVEIDIPITNPTSESLMKFQVQIHGSNLVGNDSISIQPGKSENYRLTFVPSTVGKFDGRLVFFNENIGEFWFKLNLTAEPPKEQSIPEVKCELGKWRIMEIPLRNIDNNHKLIIYPEISNPECFNIHVKDIELFDHEKQCFTIPPNSKQNLVVKFTPCEIGSKAHNCLLILKSKMLGDWNFNLNGCGMPPQPSDVIGVSANAGSNMTLLIPFHNPLLEAVLIDINVTENNQSVLDKYRFGSIYSDKDIKEMESGVFKLLLKNNRKLKLEAKQSIEIPISFAPQEMRKYNAICSIVMRRKNGEPVVSEDDFDRLILPNTDISSTYDKNVLRWLFPIMGIPEASVPLNVFSTPLIQGPLRIETKEILEFSLWGLPPPVLREDILTKSVKSAPVLSSEGNDYKPIDRFLQEFSTELKLKSIEVGDTIDSVTLNDYIKLILVKQNKQLDNGGTVLTYEFRMKPMKKFKVIAELVITSSSGGVWRFPIRFVAHDCEPDDEVIIEAIGLNKPVSVKFILNSKTFEELPFKAYFLKGGDPDFSVYPESGNLPPMNSCSEVKSSGMEFIVTWSPKSYGRSKGARLVIETDIMEWVYKFVGVNPQYIVPDSSSIVQTNWENDFEKDKRQKLDKRKNFLRQNIELLSTAVSSPIKGAPLFPKIV